MFYKFGFGLCILNYSLSWVGLGTGVLAGVEIVCRCGTLTAVSHIASIFVCTCCHMYKTILSGVVSFDKWGNFVLWLTLYTYVHSELTQ